MPYQLRTTIASRIETTEAELIQLETQGWISTVGKNGMVFMLGKHEYKARFILHLRRQWSLSDADISRVLDVQRPPYSLKDVPVILGRKMASKPLR